MENEYLSNERSKKSKIQVIFADGESICYKNPIDTMMDVLKRIEPEKLNEIKLESKGKRLITRTVDPEDEPYKEEIGKGWWYINKFVNTDNKYLQLSEINRCLDMGLQIKIGPDLEVTNKIEKEQKKRRKKKLFIKLPNDYVLTGDSSADVFRKFVKAVGTEEIARKNILWKNQPLITTSNTSGKRYELAPYRWLLDAKSTKEAADMAFIVSRHLNLACEIEMK